MEDETLHRFFQNARRGRFRTADEFAGGIAQFARSRSHTASPPRSAARTDAGVVRSLNEDTWGWRSAPNFMKVYVVADGMGGHSHGDAASQLATRTFLRTVEKSLRTPKNAEKSLLEGFKAANQAVTKTSLSGAGTTLVGMIATGKEMLVANVGDSRAYLLRDGHLSAITEDHSMVAAMVATGKIKAEDAWTHPKANVLLHYIGATGSVDPDVYTTAPRAGDRFLLCSDGLWGEVPNDAIQEILDSHTDPRKAVQHLVEAATAAGGRDNITVVVVDW